MNYEQITKTVKSMFMKQLKQWLHDNAYWLTPLNTLLIIIGISIGFWQRRGIEKKSDFSLRNQDLMIKADSERFKMQILYGFIC